MAILRQRFDAPLSFILSLIIVVNAGIDKKFVSNTASKSLFCNSCAWIADTLNHSLFEVDNVFETNIGFRLDSNGKKIRKNSQWLRVHITLEDIHCDWRKDLFKVAKRKSGQLYLISNDDIKRNEKLNKKNKKKALSEKLEYFTERKPKILKTDSKYNKMIDNMCLLITELFDEWLIEKRTMFQNTPQNQDISKSLNMTEFCLNDLKYKKKQICTESMLNFKLDLYSDKRILLQNKTKIGFGIDRISPLTRWFILDILFCYGIILTVLALFNILDAPIIICKLSIIPMLFCPNYIYQRNPSFGNLSTWWLIWYWYALRFWDIFNNQQFFRNKSYAFCWFFSGMMKNMYKASIKPSTFNIEAFVMMIFNVILMIQVFPYIFNTFLRSKMEIDAICYTALYPNIILKITEILSYVCCILYGMDYGGVFLLNIFGYNVEYDMVSPWKSYSLREFWGKRWNQFVAYILREMVYKQMRNITNNKQISLIIVFIVLGIIHAFPMWLDAFPYNVLIIAFIWFILQPLFLFIEDKIIIPFSCGSNTVNTTIHCVVTFGILFGSFLLSLRLTCYVEKEWNSD